MGNRLSKIYTRTGDAGDTGLGDGSRTAKDSARVEAYGTTDELNSILGVLLSQTWPEPSEDGIPVGASDWILEIQHDLFDIGGELCVPGYVVMTETHVTRLENWLDQLNAKLPPLKEFILRGGTAAAAQVHFACTVSRRAERRMVSLHNLEAINAHSLAYINRLSDFLFVLARALNQAESGTEILWQRGRFESDPKGNES